MNRSVLKLFAIATVLLGFATHVNASLQTNPILSLGDAFYVGLINDGIPANPPAQVGYVNFLTTLGAGAGDTVNGTETYNRLSSTHLGPFATAVTLDGIKDETAPLGSIDVGTMTFQYILGKYDQNKAGTLVWYNADGFTGTITVPATFNTHGVSHISAYNKGVVPEPATIFVWSLLATAAIVGSKKWRSRG